MAAEKPPRAHYGMTLDNGMLVIEVPALNKEEYEDLEHMFFAILNQHRRRFNLPKLERPQHGSNNEPDGLGGPSMAEPQQSAKTKDL